MRRGSTWARIVMGDQRQITFVERKRRSAIRSASDKERNEQEQRRAHAAEREKERAEQASLAPYRRIVSHMKCYWCGLPYGKGTAMRTKEHVIPRSAGGRDCFDNIVWAHQKCNTVRGSNENWIPFHIHKQEGKVMWR